MPPEDLAAKVAALAKQKGAVILAHNYQLPEVQGAADFVGDSLELAMKASSIHAELILFCGVHFMAETAAILNPGATVLEPDPNAGCPLANMLNARQLMALKAEHPGAVVVTYVNSSAEVKAETDICCTSGNALKVVGAIPREKDVIFVPDKSLGAYVAGKLGRELIFWDGYCPTHHRISAEAIVQARREHPAAKVVVHPECTPDVTALADDVASTSGILRYAATTPYTEYIVGTEIGLLHRLRKENPGKLFYSPTRFADCPNMKLNTLEKMLWSLEDMQYEVSVPYDVAAKARGAVMRMLEYT
jgi:quinolinate synthase